MEASTELRHNRTYRYSPLQDPITQFRLFKLSVDGANAPITGELQIYSIDSSPSYEAISYCWGDPKASEVVSIGGEEASVNGNCLYALWQVRTQSTETRLLWIDTICINQQDLAEKTAQVQRMSTIYQNATQVFACLGRDDDDSTFLLQTLSQLEPQETVELSSLNILRATTMEDELQRKVINWMVSLDRDFPRFATALKALSRRAFFSRMWIYQEMFLAPEVKMLCGEDVVSMFVLKDIDRVCSTLVVHFRPMQEYDYKEAQIQLLQMLSQHELFWHESRFLTSGHQSGLGNLPIFIHRLHRGKRALQKLEYASPSGIVEELKSIRPLKCYDPRDKIYGILSAFKECSIVPDYTISTFELALRALREYARSTDAYPDCVALADMLCANLQLHSDMPESQAALSRFTHPETHPQTSPASEPSDTLMPPDRNPWACQITSSASGHLTVPLRGPLPSKPDTPPPLLLSPTARPGDWLMPLGHYTSTHTTIPRLGLLLRERADGLYAIVGEAAFSPHHQACISWENCGCEFGPDSHPDFATGFGVCFDCEELLLLALRLRGPFAEMQGGAPAGAEGEARLPEGPVPGWRVSFARRRDATGNIVSSSGSRRRGEARGGEGG